MMNEVSRPKKADRIVPTAEGEDYFEVWVTSTQSQKNDGVSLEYEKSRQGFVADESTRTPDGNRVLMRMPRERYNREILFPARKRIDALQGLRPDESASSNGKTSVMRDIEIVPEVVTGKDIFDAATKAASEA